MLVPNATLQRSTRIFRPGRSIAIIELEDDLSKLNLPAGISAEVAVYTEHFHHVAIIRKVLLRMNKLAEATCSAITSGGCVAPWLQRLREWRA